MNRNYKTEETRNEVGSFRKLVRATFVLALVFSAGLIVGKRVGEGESVLPFVGRTTDPVPQPMVVIDTGEEHLGTDYSFYELLAQHPDPKSKGGANHKQKEILSNQKVLKDTVDDLDHKKTTNAQHSNHASSGHESHTNTKNIESNKTLSNVTAANHVVLANAKKVDAPIPGSIPKISSAKSKDNPKQPTSTESPKFTLQIGSHVNKHDAQEEIEALGRKGLEPYMMVVEVPRRGTFYRVRVGKYATLSEARRAQHELQSMSKVSSFVSPI